MNLRRILQGLSLCLFIAFYSNNVQAQAQLAAVDQDGLIQLGANHPFVVDEYQIDVASLNLRNQADAIAFFEPYMDGFSFRFELADDKVYFTIPRAKITDKQISVDLMNQQLRNIHRLSR